MTQCCMCGKTGLSTVEGDGGTECELSDGRWTCSQDCWERAVDPTLPNDDRMEPFGWFVRYDDKSQWLFTDIDPDKMPTMRTWQKKTAFVLKTKKD